MLGIAEARAANLAGEREQVLGAGIVEVPAGPLRDNVGELLETGGVGASMVPSA